MGECEKCNAASHTRRMRDIACAILKQILCDDELKQKQGPITRLQDREGSGREMNGRQTHFRKWMTYKSTD